MCVSIPIIYIDTDKLQVIISEKNGLNQGLIWCGLSAEKNNLINKHGSGHCFEQE